MRRVPLAYIMYPLYIMCVKLTIFYSHCLQGALAGGVDAKKDDQADVD